MEREKHYEELYAKAHEVLQRIDPCEITIVDGKPTCTSTRASYAHGSQLCCTNCSHLAVDGCTIEALSCKLWLCMYVKTTTKGQLALKELAAIEKQAYEEGIPKPYRDSPFKIL
jgi:hypothetical protein